VRLSVDIEATVPHINLAFGPSVGNARLQATCDTCATVSIGNISWIQNYATEHFEVGAVFFSSDHRTHAMYTALKELRPSKDWCMRSF
jgi:hypothetical protein